MIGRQQWNASCSCPACHTGPVQKVSAVFHGGTMNGYAHGVTVGQVGAHRMSGNTFGHYHAQTKLSALLAPPQEPANFEAVLLIIGGMILAFPLLCASYVFVDIVQHFVASPAQYIQQTGEPPLAFVIFIVVLALLLAGLLFVFWLIVRAVGTMPQRRQQALQPWMQAMNRWNQLYYCHQCDLVFNQIGQFVPSQQMHMLLGR